MQVFRVVLIGMGFAVDHIAVTDNDIPSTVSPAISVAVVQKHLLLGCSGCNGTVGLFVFVGRRTGCHPSGAVKAPTKAAPLTKLLLLRVLDCLRRPSSSISPIIFSSLFG
jgi:hypothetical protein